MPSPSAAPKPPDPAAAWNAAWTKMWGKWNVFLVSLPRRGGIVNLVKKWPRVEVSHAIHALRELEETCGRCAAELEEHYPS